MGSWIPSVLVPGLGLVGAGVGAVVLVGSGGVSSGGAGAPSAACAVPSLPLDLLELGPPLAFQHLPVPSAGPRPRYPPDHQRTGLQGHLSLYLCLER